MRAIASDDVPIDTHEWISFEADQEVACEQALELRDCRDTHDRRAMDALITAAPGTTLQEAEAILQEKVSFLVLRNA